MSKRPVRLLLVLALISLLRLSAEAQEPAPPAKVSPVVPSQQTQAKPGAKSEEEKQIEKKEQSRRVLGLIPDFGMTNRQNASPLTAREKFHLFAKSAFDPAMMVVVGLQAGLSQDKNEFPGYGQGAQGYGKRYGASLADEVSAGFFTNYLYPTLFNEDPRYFRLGEGGFGHRLFYGVKQEFVCHADKGGRSFNYSTVLGAFTSGAISNLYYPGNTLIRTLPATSKTPAIPVYENDRGAILTFSRASIALGYGVIGSLFDEFWPDVRRKLFRRHPGPDETQPGSGR